MAAMDKVGAYNIYNIYDTCGSGNMSSSDAAIPKRSDDDDDDSATVGSFKSLLDLLRDGEPDQAADKGAEEDTEHQSGSSEAAGIEKETALFSEHRAQLEGCGSSVSSHHHRRTQR